MAGKKERLLKLNNEMQSILMDLVDSPSSNRYASDLMKRAKKIESAKKGATVRKHADDTSPVPITVSYMKKNKAGKFACDGTPVEVVLDRTSTYSDVIQKACEHLDVPRDSRRQLVLLTYGGAVIPEKEGWNLGQYMQQLHRGPGNTKLGVGFIKPRSVEDDQHTSHTSTSGYLSQVPSKTLDTSSMTSAMQDPLVRKKAIVLSSGEESDSDSDFEIPKKKRKTTSTVKHAPKPAAPAERASRQLPQRPISAQSMEFFASELASATRNYARSTVIGKGGFGTVYKGYLRHSHVAIKVLSKKGQQAFMRAKPSVQFNTEVYMLSRFRHGNIVQLFGFCSKPSALIFEYMAKGSLFHNLHEVDIAETLNWEERTSILRDACRGLAFLHSATPPIVHQDIKSANVLIDEFKQAKLGDFGFSVELPHVSGGSTLFTAECIARTEGYYPSEITSGKISDRSDVYSFGVVVLEVYTASLVYCSKRQDPKLVDHLQEELLDFNKFQGLYDVMTDRPLDSLVETYFQVISACMRKHSARPSSAEVLRMLGN